MNHSPAALRWAVLVAALLYTLASLWARRAVLEPSSPPTEVGGLYTWHSNFLDAEHLVASGQPKRAELPLHRVLDEVPDHWAALQLLGDVLLDHDVNAASNAYLDTTATDSASSLAVYRLGQACEEVGDPEAMRGQCMQALWLNPRNGPALRCLARGFMLSRLETADHSADVALSLRYLSRAMYVDPSDVRAVLQYCDQLVLHGADAAAEACLEDLAREHSKYIDVLLRLALLSVRHEGLPPRTRGWPPRAAAEGAGGRVRGLLEVVVQAGEPASDASPQLHGATFVLADSEAAMLQTVHHPASKHLELERWWMWALPLIARFKIFAMDFGLPTDACLTQPGLAVASRYPEFMAASAEYRKMQKDMSYTNRTVTRNIGTGVVTVLAFESPALSVLESSPHLDQAVAHFLRGGLSRWFPDSACPPEPDGGEDEVGVTAGSDACTRRLFCLDVGAGRGSLSAPLKRRCLVLTALDQATRASYTRTEYTSTLTGEAISTLRSQVNPTKSTGGGANNGNGLEAQDVIVAVDVAPYATNLQELLSVTAPLLYAGNPEAGHPPGVLVITVDLIGTCSYGGEADEPLTAETLRGLSCPAQEVVLPEYLLTRGGRMVASPCHLVVVAALEGLEVIEAVRVDSAPVLGTPVSPYSSSASAASGAGAAPGTGTEDKGEGIIASYIIVMQHQS